MAVTSEQVDQFGLATDTPKATDRGRYAFDWTCQVAALDPGDLSTILTEAIE